MTTNVCHASMVIFSYYIRPRESFYKEIATTTIFRGILIHLINIQLQHNHINDMPTLIKHGNWEGRRRRADLLITSHRKMDEILNDCRNARNMFDVCSLIGPDVSALFDIYSLQRTCAIDDTLTCLLLYLVFTIIPFCISEIYVNCSDRTSQPRKPVIIRLCIQPTI